MEQQIQVAGMTCSACEAKIKYLFEQHKSISEAKINLETGQVNLQVSSELELDALEGILLGHDKYKIVSSPTEEKKGTSFWQTYKPLLITAIAVAVVSMTANLAHDEPGFMRWMRYFMAGFFIAFSFFKFLDIKGFASSFSMYDPLAAKVPVYGRIYPFLEFGLGLLFILDFNYLLTNIATIVLLGISTIGVIQSVIDKRKIQCACIGTIFDLPMSKVTIIENSIMIGMAIAMVIVKSI